MLTFPRKGLIFGGDVKIWPTRAGPKRSKRGLGGLGSFGGRTVTFPV